MQPTTPIVIRPWNSANLILRTTIVSLVVITVYALTTLSTRGVDFWAGVDMLGSNFGALLFAPQLKNITFEKMIHDLFITVGLGFLTTMFGAAIALGLSLLAAQNLSPRWVTVIVKGCTAFIRAVPTVLWVLIFAVSAGLGSVAAVLGMTFHSAGYLIKAYSESFEEIEQGTIEALQASGADWWQIVFQAVLPSSATALLSWTFLRFEINFSTAIAMGAAAGAGGIGYDMFMASGFYLNLHEMGAFTYAVLAFAIVLEASATRLKASLRQ
ncbi:MAG: ABC transporter permease subunit [Chloroflexia bacterium]|nr:ABC transporter permease subunit [Chloroflexia bacterium]